MSDTLNSEIIKSYISVPFSHPILVYSTTDSTNTEALKHAFDNNAMYSVIVSDTQTNGKGRQGKSFYSPGETGIYLSMLLPRDNIHILQITPAIAVAVCRTIEEVCNVHAEIKWINDIIIAGKKVCGILCESIPATDLIVAGIGLNYTTSSFPEDLKKRAGSLFPEPGKNSTRRNEFIGRLINHLLAVSLSYESCIPEYRQRSCVLGKEIRYLESGIWHQAHAIDIDNRGGLMVFENGMHKTLYSGEITIRSQNPYETV